LSSIASKAILQHHHLVGFSKNIVKFVTETNKVATTMSLVASTMP
jgi:hypothetical protein